MTTEKSDEDIAREIGIYVHRNFISENVGREAALSGIARGRELALKEIEDGSRMVISGVEAQTKAFFNAGWNAALEAAASMECPDGVDDCEDCGRWGTRIRALLKVTP